MSRWTVSRYLPGMAFLDKLFRPRLRVGSVPEGCRVYAIGDVHGRLDLLETMVGLIEQDLQRRTTGTTTTIILLGDLINRGPHSVGVLHYVRRLADRYNVRCLKGNHEEVFLRTVDGDTRAARMFWRMGGDATMRALGITDADAADGGFADLIRLLQRHAPVELVDFMRSFDDRIELGDYLFVHAGIRPGISIDQQKAADMRWIREDFTGSVEDHGRVVVHGHTITKSIVDLPNRIGLDTGGYATGQLSAVGLEADRRWFLATGTDDVAAARGAAA